MRGRAVPSGVGAEPADRPGTESGGTLPVGNLTVDAWREMVDREGAAGPTAFVALHHAMEAAAASLARAGKIRRSDADVLAQDATADVAMRGGTSLVAVPEAVPGAVPLVAWCRGVITNYARRLYRADRATRPLLDGLDPPAPDAPDPDDGALPPCDRADLDARVAACGATELQRSIYRLRIHERRAFGAIARELRRNGKTIWESWQGLQHRLIAPPPSAPTKDWTAAAIARATAKGDARTARVFALHAAGRTHAEIARETGLAPGYIAVKVARARRRDGEIGRDD